MSDELTQHLQFLADVNARVKRTGATGTIRHARNFQGVSRYYSEGERMNAERIEREQPKDITQILAENPKLNFKANYPEQDERERRSREIEAQMLAEREAGNAAR
jgi:hypothetical protein